MISKVEYSQDPTPRAEKFCVAVSKSVKKRIVVSTFFVRSAGWLDM